MERCSQAKSGKLESGKLNWNVALRQKWKVGKQKVELKRCTQAKVESWKAKVELKRRSQAKVESWKAKVELERRFQAKVESWKAKVELERRSEASWNACFVQCQMHSMSMMHAAS